RGKIEKIVDDIKADSVVFLINAIYFNGKWTREFDASKTKPERFTTASGSAKQVPLMRQKGTYSYLEEPDFQAISLPYGNGRLSMYVFLPAEASSLKAFHGSLTADNWNKWMNGFDKGEGEIAFPRFNVEYEVELTHALKSLGIRSAFDPQNADFGAMIRGPLAYISAVKHKAVAEVTEEGTVAAAATSTEMRVVSMQIPNRTFRMIVNRPFLFAITDNTSGLILFIGSVADPS
ncbi:MAG: serpin family protein, partial [Acidobacteriota bacterium]